jgi:hypothetical protein
MESLVRKNAKKLSLMDNPDPVKKVKYWFNTQVSEKFLFGNIEKVLEESKF